MAIDPTDPCGTNSDHVALSAIVTLGIKSNKQKS